MAFIVLMLYQYVSIFHCGKVYILKFLVPIFMTRYTVSKFTESYFGIRKSFIADLWWCTVPRAKEDILTPIPLLLLGF